MIAIASESSPQRHPSESPLLKAYEIYLLQTGLHFNSSQFNSMADKPERECVKVAVRCRPMAPMELDAGYREIVRILPDRGEIIIENTKDSGEKQRVFSFDMVFDQRCHQQEIFKQAALPIVESVLQGYNGTIFAYGQTGTGKTHTMEGSKTDVDDRGIIPRTFQHIIKSIEGTPGVNFMVQISMLELYNEEIVDLFSKEGKKLQLHEDKEKGVYVKDLKSIPVTAVEEMKKLLMEGSKNRHQGSTDMNKGSSRSHSIFVVKVEQEYFIKGQQKSKIKAGRLNLVDLAGSERQKKTNAQGKRCKEGIYINLALSALGNVISALVNPKSDYIPYRDSKLTRLLQQSLGGNSKTIMIANVGPANYNYEETMSTLRYASHAKDIKNKPKVNEDPKDTMIREFQEQIQRLKRQLEGKTPADGVEPKKQKVKKDLNLRLKEEKERFEHEKDAILNQELQKKKELETNLGEINKKKEEEKKKQEELAIKLKEMKNKLLMGDKLKEQARLHDKKLHEAEQELMERKQQERRLAEELDKKNLEFQNLEEGHLSLKEKVELRRKEMIKINNRLKVAHQANKDIEEFMKQERQEIQEENRAIVHELKLVKMIIENFVPISEVASIQHRLEFDESFDDWVIIDKSTKPKQFPGSALGYRYPLCSEGRLQVACGDDNPKYRQQNIIMMDLDIVESPIEDFRYQLSENVLENLSVVLKESEEEQRLIAKEEMPNVYIDEPEKMNKEEIMKQRENTTRAKTAKSMRPQSGKKKKN